MLFIAFSVRSIHIFVNTTLRITPEKRNNPRMFKVSAKLLAMLSILPRKSDLVFGTYEMRGFRPPYIRQLKRIAQKLGTPRLNQITFHIFRHWKATMEYHYTCKAAANVKDATELIEAGYEYVCDMDNIKLFRKKSESMG